MKFKVGDKVRLVKTDDEIEAYKNYIGKTFTIKGIRKEDGEYFADLAETYDIIPYLKNLELVNKEYTYEDLKKAPIGTKVLLEKLKDEILIKITNKKYESDNFRFFIEEFENLKTPGFGKIIKIEEPEYSTVYEDKSEILDEVEKRYLRNVIRPFRSKASYIVKYKSIDFTDKEYIAIIFNFNTHNPRIALPYFEKNTMYKGMEADKNYTLEELGL